MARLEFECTCNTEDRDGTPTSSRLLLTLDDLHETAFLLLVYKMTPCLTDMCQGIKVQSLSSPCGRAPFVFCSCSSRCLKLLISRRKFYNINKSFIDRARRCFVHCSAKPLLDARWMWPPCAICAPCVSCLARSWLARRIPRARTFYMLLYELNYSLTF